jgi:hypothetical protein
LQSPFHPASLAQRCILSFRSFNIRVHPPGSVPQVRAEGRHTVHAARNVCPKAHVRDTRHAALHSPDHSCTNGASSAPAIQRDSVFHLGPPHSTPETYPACSQPPSAFIAEVPRRACGDAQRHDTAAMPSFIHHCSTACQRQGRQRWCSRPKACRINVPRRTRPRVHDHRCRRSFRRCR